MSRGKLLSQVVATLAFALAYFALGRLSLAVGVLFQENTSLIWLPTGLSYAWLLTRGAGAWPGVLLGALATAASTGASLPVVAAIGVANTLEALTAAVMLSRSGFDPSFSRLRHVLFFVACGVLAAPLIGTAVGAGALHALGALPSELLWLNALSWWGWDALGALILFPTALALLSPGPMLGVGSRLEAIAWLLCIAIMGYFVLGPAQAPHYPFKYLFTPFVALLAVRFQHVGTSLAALVLAVLMAYAWGASQAHLESLDIQRYMLFQLLGFIAVNTLVGLVAATVISQRDLHEARLRARAEELQTMLDAVPAAVVLAPSPNLHDMVGNRMARELMRIPEGSSMFTSDQWWADSGRHFERAGLVVGNSELPLPRALRGETVFNDQIDACYEDGSRRQLLANAVPLLNEVGQVRGAVAALADITELTQAQQQLKLADEALEHSGEALMVVGSDGKLLRVNRAFTRLTGYREADVLGQDANLVAERPVTEAEDAAMKRALASQGVWEGEISNRRADGQIYPAWYSISCVRDHSGEITHYILIFSDITERKRAESSMKHLAEHDFLTGLPNRVLFNDRLGQAVATAQRNGERFTLMFLDLDRFKIINDTLGHSVGDALLVQLARRLVEVLRGGDTVCRQGGDEFVVLLPGTSTAQGARHLAQKLLDVIDQPFSVEEHELSVTASIGVVFYPDDGGNADELLRHADVAMYHAKSSGRHNFQFFTASLNARAAEMMRLEFALKRALEQRELLVYYQPQVRVSDQVVVALESLLRWPVAEGFVSPAEFIPVAEDSGLIVQIGEWVLEESCRQLSVMPSASDLSIAVNVSALQFRQRDFVGMVQRVITRHGIPPERLELEVTESVVMHDLEDVIEKMQQLKALGVGIAIDDFGKGYSSLSYLKRFPITKLKIDQSFIRDCTEDQEDASIVEAIISLARSLGLEIIAEGVETPEQLEFLRLRECEMAQGYLLGRPMPAEKLADFLACSGRPGALA